MLIAHSIGTMKQGKQLVLGVLLSLLAVVIAGPKLGVYRGPSPYGPDNLAAYQTWLGGQTLNYALDFTADGSWSNIEGGSWLWNGWSPWVNGAPVGDRIWVISVPMCPDNVTSTLTTMQKGATGAYNSYFTALGNSLVAYNLSNSILRIGWEFNLGTDFKWNSAANATLWAQFFQQIVTTLRAAKGQSFQYLWNPGNNAPGASAYPGDSYVDIVGVDTYDACWISTAPAYLTGLQEAGYWYVTRNWTQGVAVEYQEHLYESLSAVSAGGPSPDQDTTNWKLLITPDQYNSSRAQCLAYFFSGYYGLDYWSSFARQHNKPLALVEWGVWNRGDGHGGGDNPSFIQAIHDFVMNETNNVLFFSYFDVYAQDGNHQLVPQTGIYADFPQSAALFQQLFTKSAFSSSSSSSSGGSSSSPASTLLPSFRLSDLF